LPRDFVAEARPLVAKAREHLAKAIAALASSDLKRAQDETFYALLEAEHAAFLLFLALGDAAFSLRKKDVVRRAMTLDDPGRHALQAERHVEDAERLLRLGDVRGAYASLWLGKEFTRLSHYHVRRKREEKERLERALRRTFRGGPSL